MNVNFIRLGVVIMSSAMLSHTNASAETKEIFADTDTIAYNLPVNEVVVTGSRSTTDVRHLPMTLSIVGRNDLTMHQRQNILPTLMEEVPGLMVTSRGVMGYGVSTGAAGGMMLRGLSSGTGQLMVMIDGHPQYNGIYGHSIADSYQTMLAERVEVLRGPASLLYGSNAMGGVINIVTRGMKKDGVKTEINVGGGSYGTLQAEASNEVRKGNFSSTVAGQYGRSDNHRPNMDFEQYGGFIKLNYDITDHWNVYADANLTHFNSSYPGTTQNPMLEADQWITRGVANIGVENHYARTSGRVSAYDNFGRHKINDGYAANGGTRQNRLFRSKDALAGISAYQNFNAWTDGRFTIGIDYQHIYGRAYYTSRETGEVLETQNKQSGHVHNNEVAAYIDLRQDIVDLLTIDLGLRYDNHSVTGGEWIPQIGLVVRPMATGEVKLMASKGFRNPTMREMYLYPPSNEELDPERMWTYELSWKHRVADNRLRYGINIFYISGDNIIQTVNRQNVNTGEIENKGIEAQATWNITQQLYLTTNHSFLKMDNPVVGAPTYKGYLGMNYVSRNGIWDAGVGLTGVGGLYKAIGENEEKEDFVLLNATISCHICKPLSVWVKGENLLAQKYEINAGYPMPKATVMGGLNFTIGK